VQGVQATHFEHVIDRHRVRCLCTINFYTYCIWNAFCVWENMTREQKGTLPETKQWSISWLIEILCSLVSFRNVSLVLKQNVLTTWLHFQLCH
jgi:hypothetical protein